MPSAGEDFLRQFVAVDDPTYNREQEFLLDLIAAPNSWQRLMRTRKAHALFVYCF